MFKSRLATCSFTKDALSELMGVKIHSILLQNGPEAKATHKKEAN